MAAAGYPFPALHKGLDLEAINFLRLDRPPAGNFI
jgi:hypothetical protein